MEVIVGEFVETVFFVEALRLLIQRIYDNGIKTHDLGDLLRRSQRVYQQSLSNTAPTRAAIRR